MEDSQFCINDDVEGNIYNLKFLVFIKILICIETPKNSPARVVVSESTTVDLGKFSQSSSSLVNDHVSLNVS